ncbi:Protein kinase domain-containing protein ppk32 [Golovinomyces cichoracearum]|uniref:Protein kinase domain-containing protein ppk32 n=1 Tax=Golovinomyces cichoracearum TaxID=62708 RepID=A0A420J0A9_9PEZI|nr:Protein kinase domain-containing protein ppk32 [Golovinomyces cichoracearum]
MFSSALKSFSSNINSNYSISPTPTSTTGPWKIHDAKKKNSGKLASVFILERKTIEKNPGNRARSSSSALKRASDEVLERLRKEASSLARLRHPNILELVEPLEETRSGGLQFVTETVTTSLSGLLQEREDRERDESTSYISGQNFKEDLKEGNNLKAVELNEIEIQKGLEQISKALEFLHDNAGLVHGNLTPDAILINSKYDWKISGLSFLSPPDGSNKTSSIIPINLSETLNINPRLPQSVQINLDYCSPDFVLDNNLNVAADMFSLGLLIIALYNSPHTSPLRTNSSISTYKRLLSSPATTPTLSNGFLSARPMPKDLITLVLPRLLARKPAERMTAKELQQSPYFDNILIATIRFLDTFPAKTPNEKAQFMRGLSSVIPSFPEFVLEKKMVTALLEEMKDPKLVSLILQNIFQIINHLQSGRKCFTEKIMPKMKEIFVVQATSKSERDQIKDAGLIIVLEHIRTISENCSAAEFKDYILPIIQIAIESPTHAVVDASLRSLPIFLPVLDFTTVKNELFPVIASIFSKTSSLGIKVRGLEAFYILCGGSHDSNDSSGGFGGAMETSGIRRQNSSTVLDKYTMQEKIIPLIRAIKTKEPAVAIAALNVLRQIGSVADHEFIALEIFPVLWTMSLGPLLDLNQFQSFMETIQKLSSRVENEHIKKLQELSGSNESKPKINDAIISLYDNTAPENRNSSISAINDFERLVKKPNFTPESFGSLASTLNNAPVSVLQPSQSSMTNSFARSTPSTASSALDTSRSDSFSSSSIPNHSFSDTLNRTKFDNNSTIDNPSFLQQQSSTKLAHRSSSNFPGGMLRSQTLPKDDWNKIITPNTHNKSNRNDLTHLASPYHSSSHISLGSDSCHKSAYMTLTPIRLHSEIENSPIITSASNINSFSIPPPQIQSQMGISSVSHQTGLGRFSLPSPEILAQSQQKTQKNELDNWKSLI